MPIKSSSQISLTDLTDAYSISLTSETYTFAGESTGAQPGLTCTTKVVAYCGSNQCNNVNVGTIECPTGISATITDNGGVSPTITFTTTSIVTDSCEATIPITVDGVTISKMFSFSVAMSADSAALDDLTERVSQTEADLDNKVTKGTVSSEISQEDGIITITGDRLIVDTTNLNISKDGAVECSSMDITGGRISLSSDSTAPLIDVTYVTPTHNNKTYLSGTSLYTNVNGNRITDFDLSAGILHIYDSTGSVCTSITREVVDAPCIVAAHNITGATISAYSSMNIYKPGSLSEDAIKIWADSEGGNIQITSPNGVTYQMDAYNDNLRIYTFNSSNSLRIYTFDREGTFSAPSNIAAGLEFISTHYTPFRSVHGNYGFFIRNDGSNIYFMLTNSGDQYGSYNSLRPLIINASTGAVSINQALYINGMVPVCSCKTSDSTWKKVTQVIMFADTNNVLISGDKGNYVFAVSAWSDKRLKKNINDSTISALDKINKIQFREFDFINEQYGDHQDIGYVADELKNVFPECVVSVPQDKEKCGYDELYQVQDTGMIKYLGKAIQELSEIVNKQNKQIELLKQEIDELKSNLV